MGGRKCYAPKPPATAAPWDCWKDNIVAKTGGFWYSSTGTGYCADGQTKTAGGGPCMWRVDKVVKKIAKNCSDDKLYTLVEKEGSRCFEHCNLKARNVTDPCWIHCFYDTVLGPDAGAPGGALAGMPMEQILGVWDQTFGSDDSLPGACPAIA